MFDYCLEALYTCMLGLELFFDPHDPHTIRPFRVITVLRVIYKE